MASADVMITIGKTRIASVEPAAAVVEPKCFLLNLDRSRQGLLQILRGQEPRILLRALQQDYGY
ncbi:MAG: hypothetical protein CM15mP49_20990 [Actinomycetota bacterium]|nr:MAG: hypothetical protein CM15mP49_20990 [Actinomycetota bacterium]